MSLNLSRIEGTNPLMTRAACILAVGLLATLAGQPAAADLIGSSVTGSLEFSSSPNNYYDPALGFVPDGYLNKT